MKKFMKVCFILAMVLIIVGCVCYMVGRNTEGRERMDEVLSQISGDRLHLDLENSWGIFGSDDVYDINDASVFRDDYEIWQGDVEKQKICQGDFYELDLEIGGSMVEIDRSEDEYVYIKAENAGKLQAYLENGVLYVRSVRPSSLSDEIKNSRITLYLPKDCRLVVMDVSLGAGQLKAKDLQVDEVSAEIGAGQLQLENVEAIDMEFSLGAGEIIAKQVSLSTLSAQIGAGNLEFSGEIRENAEIECSMGNVRMKLEGEKLDYNYELDCVAGNMEIGGDKYSGAAVSKEIDNGAEKSIDIECSMGNVEVEFE